MDCRKTFISLVSAVLIMACVSFAQAQQCQKPITYLHFKSAIQKGRSQKKSAADFIELVKGEGVDFPLTPQDSQTLRRIGSYLGRAGLEDLQKAVSENRCKAKSVPAVSQTITNSPGSIQAIDSTVTIHQGVQQRKLTSEQESLFTSILKGNPKGSIEISCVESAGPEPCNFARQVTNLLQAQGWTVNFAPVIFAAGDPTKTIPDVYILVKKGNVPSRAGVLQTALKNVGIDAVGIERDDVAADYVQLMISPKGP